jgi:hypothetical protein
VRTMPNFNRKFILLPLFLRFAGTALAGAELGPLPGRNFTFIIQ